MTEFSTDQQKFIDGVKDFLYEDFPRSSYITLQGHAGTGKTLVISALKQLFKDTRFEYVVYTGKAADNLNKKGVKASTIYSRFYKVDRTKAELSFILLPPDKDKYVIVIDEVSMISQEMFDELLSLGKKIIAVGDRNQLGPVKKEYNHLLDNPDYILTEVHRQAEQSGILKLANEYKNTHKFPPYGQYSDDVTVIPRDQVTMEMILSSTQAICGTNATREKWNSIIRRAHNHLDYFPEVGERVICCRNTAINIDGRKIINGTTGTVNKTKVRGGNQLDLSFKPDWTDHPVVLRVEGSNFVTGKSPDSSRYGVTFDFAYVITVNKAQGSEWDNVLYIVDPEIPGESFHRNVNTGITRASKKLILAY